ncbi:MAG TPA: hypothetical protein VFU21_01270 [Kofleriaceae bacterium]|nr:hypothetical protein [Kofleriaceae bacterium]
MARSDDSLRRRAARAYERGRMASALGLVAPVAVLLIGVPLVTGSGPACAAAGGLLALAGAAASWRGGLAGRAARAGLLAGLAPLVAPIAVGAIGHRCTGCTLPASLPLCIAACVTAGAAAGAILWLLAARERSRASFTALAVGFAAATGALGCVFAGVSGLLGMAIGLALGSTAPLLAAPRPR